MRDPPLVFLFFAAACSTAPSESSSGDAASDAQHATSDATRSDAAGADVSGGDGNVARDDHGISSDASSQDARSGFGDASGINDGSSENDASGDLAPIGTDFTPDFTSYPGQVSKPTPTFPNVDTGVEIVATPTLPYEVDHAWMVSHNEAGRSLRLGIGPAGQIFSIVDHPNWDAVGIYPWPGTAGGDGVDWVMQAAPAFAEKYESPTAKGPKPITLQQAGTNYSTATTYLGPLYDHPFYSPRLWEKTDASAHAYRTIVWPQPDESIVDDDVSRPAGILFFQDVRDIGDQAIEITYVFYNFGSRTLAQINTPWCVYNSKLLPITLWGNPSGGSASYQLKSDGSLSAFPAPEAAWQGFLDKPGGRLLAVLAGIDTKDQYADGTPLVAGVGSYNAYDAGGKGWAAAPTRATNLRPGSAMYARFFLLLDDLDRVAAKVGTLTPWAEQGLMRTPPRPVLFPVCQAGADFGECAEGATPSFYTFTSYVVGAQPVFKIVNRDTNAVYLTNDPYLLGPRPWGSPAVYGGFLGWAAPPGDLGTDGCYDLVTLRSRLPETVFPRSDALATEDLRVAKSRSIATKGEGGCP